MEIVNNSDIVVTQDQLLPSMSTEDLRRELAAQITITAKSLQRMGEIWNELERRGEDLSDLRSGGLYAFLPMIASGKLRAEMVVRFAGKAMLLRALSSLPVRQQDQLLETGKIPVALPDSPESVNEMPLANMRAEHIRIAFGQSGIRPPQEQRRMLKAMEPSAYLKKAMAQQHDSPAYIVIDADGYLKSGRRFITDKNGIRIDHDDMIDALSAYYTISLRDIVENERKGIDS